MHLAKTSVYHTLCMDQLLVLGFFHKNSERWTAVADTLSRTVAHATSNHKEQALRIEVQ